MTTKIKSGVIAAGAVDANALSDNSITIAHLNCSDGTNGQVLSTDGSGTLSFADGGVAGIVSSADATAITIDSSENVGIGTTSPDTKGRLAVSSGAGDTDIPSLYLNQRSSASDVNKGIAFGIDGTLYGRIVSGQSGSGGAMAFHTGASLTERMRIDSSGNVLIGHTDAVPIRTIE